MEVRYVAEVPLDGVEADLAQLAEISPSKYTLTTIKHFSGIKTLNFNFIDNVRLMKDGIAVLQRINDFMLKVFVTKSELKIAESLFRNAAYDLDKGLRNFSYRKTINGLPAICRYYISGTDNLVDYVATQKVIYVGGASSPKITIKSNMGDKDSFFDTYVIRSTRKNPKDTAIVLTPTCYKNIMLSQCHFKILEFIDVEDFLCISTKPYARNEEQIKEFNLEMAAKSIALDKEGLVLRTGKQVFKLFEITFMDYFVGYKLVKC